MWEALARHIFAFLAKFTRDRAARAAALERHGPLLEAIASGDAETARRLAREHVSPCLKHYEEYLQSSGRIRKE